jgi:hypothetical protein
MQGLGRRPVRGPSQRRRRGVGASTDEPSPWCGVEEGTREAGNPHGYPVPGPPSVGLVPGG